MSQIHTDRVTCGKCHKKLRNSQFKINCSLCLLTFDIKCQGLRKVDVKRLANLNLDRYWTCNSCTSQIFHAHYIDFDTRASRRTSLKLNSQSTIPNYYSQLL